jgi:signal transduction histidine kinase
MAGGNEKLERSWIKQGLPLVLVVGEPNEGIGPVAQGLKDEFNIIVASASIEALDLLRSKNPDLVVGALGARGNSDLVTKIRGRPELKNLPILVITKADDETTRRHLLEEGAQDFLLHPFERIELLARVRNLVMVKQAMQVLQETSTGGVGLKDLAQDIALQNRALEIAAESARVLKEQAEKANEVKGTFLNLVSHELRTPLTAMHLNLHLLVNNPKAPLLPQQKPVVDRFSVAARQLSNLVDALLEYTRIERGKISIEPEDFDLQAVVRQVVHDHELQAAQKKLHLKCDVDAGPIPINCDLRLVRVIISNLVDNAIKYTEHGSITLSARGNPDTCEISVKDTGPGIAPEDHQRIFQPFEQLESLKHKGVPGVGLGLALVVQIVGVLTGQVKLDSALGKGSTFNIVLPRRTETRAQRRGP